jgi:hypothetical protein
MEEETMKRFIEIQGYIIAVDSIVMVNPPGEDGKTLIQLRGGKGHVFPEEDVAKVREILFHDCFRL